MKGKTFPFEELTNFQASKLENGPITTDGSWNASGPFYTIGTLAYFMKCLGLKFSAYVRYVSYCKIRSWFVSFLFPNNSFALDFKGGSSKCQTTEISSTTRFNIIHCWQMALLCIICICKSYSNRIWWLKYFMFLFKDQRNNLYNNDLAVSILAVHMLILTCYHHNRWAQ